MSLVRMLSVDLVKEVIGANFNRYFKCCNVVNCIIADQCGFSLKFVLDCKKLTYDPYDEVRNSLSVRIVWMLKRLKDEGYIEKYSRRVWMVVK